MPRLPSYRHHRPSGLAVVTLNGKDHYLGKYGTEESRAAYDRIVARWVANGRQGAAAGSAGATVNEVLLAFWHHAEGYYRKHGRPTSRLGAVRTVSRTVRVLFGAEPAAAFGPGKLKELQRVWVDRGLSRVTVNEYAGLCRHMLGWAVAEEMVPPSVAHGLREVRGLAAGRTAALEREDVRPVDADVLEATLAKLPARGAAMVRLQLVTGMRPGEVRAVREMDVDRSLAVWVYTPGSHKTEHHGKSRRVAIGPKGQAILTPWIERGGYCFSLLNPDRPIGPDTYRGMIRRACIRADVEEWCPNRLRHNFSSMIRSMSSLDVVQVLLGHSHAATTEIYAEADMAKAMEAIAKWG